MSLQGIVIADRDGLVVRSTMSAADAARHAAHMPSLLERGRQCAEAIDEPGSFR